MLSGHRPFSQSARPPQPPPRPSATMTTSDHGIEDGIDGNVIVRVRAQVMTRDDSKGGWVPKGKGGFANVSVRKKKIQHEDSHCRYEYQIYGKSGNEDSNNKEEIVLSCAIKKDFVYHKVMPAFHHWQSDNVKLGLTFQTASDARTFDKGIQLAMGDLFEGLSESPTPHQFNVVGDDDVFMQLDLPVDKSDSLQRTPSPHSAAAATAADSPPRPSSRPIQPVGSGPASRPTSAGTHEADESSKQRLDRELRLLLRGTIDSQGSGGDDSTFKKKGCGEEDEFRDKDYSYVKFPPRPLVHEYSYPTLFDSSGKGNKSSSSSASKQKSSLRSALASPQLPVRKSTSGFLDGKSWFFGGSGSQQQQHAGNTTSSSSSSPPDALANATSAAALADKRARLLSSSPQRRSYSSNRKRFSPSPENHAASISASGAYNDFDAGSLFGRPHCVHCRESFTLSDNPRGACADAPDRWRRGVEVVTGVRCADGLLYHCTSDSEGDYVHPCECANADGHCLRRWCGITLLSFLIPCLCCYPPLIACYRCGRACGVCGGRHQAA